MNKTKLVMAGMVTLLCLLPVATKILMTVVYQLRHIATEKKQVDTAGNDISMAYPEVALIKMAY